MTSSVVGQWLGEQAKGASKGEHQDSWRSEQSHLQVDRQSIFDELRGEVWACGGVDGWEMVAKALDR